MTQEILSFKKPPLSISEQIIMLQKRGLIISDTDQTRNALKYIGYYRLSGYMIPFYENPRERHLFKSGTKFEEIINTYEFDRQLRLICLGAIEKIEVSVRALISDTMSLYQVNSHWYENKDYFKNQQYHIELMRKLRNEVGKPTIRLIRKPKESFIDHYHTKYSHPDLPPSWMIFETLSFGDISFLFKKLKDRYKKQIAYNLRLDDKILSSWMHSLCYLRNLCAHHSRVWNREMSITPKISKRHKDIQTSGKSNYLFGQIAIIKIILNCINPENTWEYIFENLFKAFPNIRIEQMGLQTDSMDILRNCPSLKETEYSNWPSFRSGSK